MTKQVPPLLKNCKLESGTAPGVTQCCWVEKSVNGVTQEADQSRICSPHSIPCWQSLTVTQLARQRWGLLSPSPPTPKSQRERGTERMDLRLRDQNNSGSSKESLEDGLPLGSLLLARPSDLVPLKLFMKIWRRPPTNGNQKCCSVNVVRFYQPSLLPSSASRLPLQASSSHHLSCVLTKRDCSCSQTCLCPLYLLTSLYCLRLQECRKL